MSIVEKAVDKLKTARSGAPVPEPRPMLEPQPFPQARRDVRSPTEEAHRITRPQPAVLPQQGSVAPVHVDFDALRTAGMYPPEENVPHIADQYRRIKRPLLANITGKGSAKVEKGQCIMVASSVPGEGKTFTSFNLALSLAMERDFNVLLIDGDVAKSDMTKILKLDQRPGLLDILVNENIHLEQVIVQTDVPRLTILPSGQWNTLATELLASKRMEHLLYDITRNRPSCVVIFDSPPLLATSEAQVLAAAMGQIIVVVAAGRTPQHVVKSGLETLNQDKSINLILNLARNTGDEKHYGDYYGGYFKTAHAADA